MCQGCEKWRQPSRGTWNRVDPPPPLWALLSRLGCRNHHHCCHLLLVLRLLLPPILLCLHRRRPWPPPSSSIRRALSLTATSSRMPLRLPCTPSGTRHGSCPCCPPPHLILCHHHWSLLPPPSQTSLPWGGGERSFDHCDHDR